MILMKALRTFIGQPGESPRRNNMIERGDLFEVATEERAGKLERTHRAERREQAVRGKQPTENKMQSAPENKSDVPLSGSVPGEEKDKRRPGTRTGGKKQQSSSPAAVAPSNSAEISESGLPETVAATDSES